MGDIVFSDREIERYGRHLLLSQVGGAGQKRLKASRVLVVGAGGLGSPVLLYLAAAGIGTLGVVDDDRVSLSNLHRQIIHKDADIGMLKVESAMRTVAALNPDIDVQPYAFRLDAGNIEGVLSDYDVIIDGSDNFPTRYLLCDACFFARKPLVSAALGQFDGQLSTFRPYEIDPETGFPFPSWRCLHPVAPPAGSVAPCAEAGILGVVAGVMGTLQGVECVKEVLKIGRSLAGRLLLYDALEGVFAEITLPHDPGNPLTGRHPTLTDLSHHR